MDFDEQYDKIYRYCYFKLRHQQMAEDITQETFLHFLENSNYCERGQKIRYLYTIAHNLCADTYRGRQTEALEDELLIEDKEDEMGNEENTWNGIYANLDNWLCRFDYVSGKGNEKKY